MGSGKGLAAAAAYSPRSSADEGSYGLGGA